MICTSNIIRTITNKTQVQKSFSNKLELFRPYRRLCTSTTKNPNINAQKTMTEGTDTNISMCEYFTKREICKYAIIGTIVAFGTYTYATYSNIEEYKKKSIYLYSNYPTYYDAHNSYNSIKNDKDRNVKDKKEIMDRLEKEMINKVRDNTGIFVHICAGVVWPITVFTISTYLIYDNVLLKLLTCADNAHANTVMKIVKICDKLTDS